MLYALSYFIFLLSFPSSAAQITTKNSFNSFIGLPTETLIGRYAHILENNKNNKQKTVNTRYEIDGKK